MPYLFRAGIKREGDRAVLAIPFNVEETCKRKGSIPVQVMIDGVGFDCMLITAGDGSYQIPISEDVRIKIPSEEEYDVAFSFLEQLPKIDSKNPFR